MSYLTDDPQVAKAMNRPLGAHARVLAVLFSSSPACPAHRFSLPRPTERMTLHKTLTHHLEIALLGVEVVERDGGLEHNTGSHVGRVGVGTGDRGESVA